MPPLVIDIRIAEDSRDVVHRAVQNIAEGRLVAFPTETVYGLAASALDEQAVARLLAVKGRAAGHPLTLAIRGAEEARDYAPLMSPLAERLARRCWPGPITLVVPDAHPESLVRRLPPAVQQAVVPSGTLGLRVPGHQLVLDVLRMMTGPLVLSSANRTGQREALDAPSVLTALGDDVDLVLDDGPCRFGQPSSVVRVEGKGYKILRAGVVPEMTLKRLSSAIILFVCTGNTCRSPMAEALARSYFARRLSCKVEELEDHGIMVVSAGVAATMGGRASPEAVKVIADMGLSLSDHETQPLTEPLVRHADAIFTMSRSHRDAILAQWPGAASRTRLLSKNGTDICDPIGGPVDRYQRCALQIRSELEMQLEDLDL
jgi:protein-tyrosine phosphatase